MNNYIKLLKLARKDIKSGKREYICIAIAIHAVKLDYYKEGQGLVKFIDNSMGKIVNCLQYWLVVYGYATLEQAMDKKLMRDYRVRYIDHLITIFKDK